MNRTDHHGTKKSHKKPGQNQGDGVGEGNQAAARRYNEGLAESMARGDSDALVEKAKRALDGDEGAELEAAEEKAKEGEP